MCLAANLWSAAPSRCICYNAIRVMPHKILREVVMLIFAVLVSPREQVNRTNSTLWMPQSDRPGWPRCVLRSQTQSGAAGRRPWVEGSQVQLACCLLDVRICMWGEGALALLGGGCANHSRSLIGEWADPKPGLQPLVVGIPSKRQLPSTTYDRFLLHPCLPSVPRPPGASAAMTAGADRNAAMLAHSRTSGSLLVGRRQKNRAISTGSLLTNEGAPM